MWAHGVWITCPFRTELRKTSFTHHTLLQIITQSKINPNVNIRYGRIELFDLSYYFCWWSISENTPHTFWLKTSHPKPFFFGPDRGVPLHEPHITLTQEKKLVNRIKAVRSQPMMQIELWPSLVLFIYSSPYKRPTFTKLCPKLLPYVHWLYHTVIPPILFNWARENKMDVLQSINFGNRYNIMYICSFFPSIFAACLISAVATLFHSM